MASRTAAYMALFRALETVRRPCEARLLEDPWAREFLSPALRAVATAAALPGVGAGLRRFIDFRWPGARASGVARTRWIDDEIRGAMGTGLRQLVILGAGYDARALRLPGMEGLRTFEVDQPETSHAKQAILRRRLGALPAHVTYLALDLERSDLSRALREAGVDAAAPTFFVWEGVTNYLSEAAVDATLRCVAEGSAPGSRILFTYVHRGLLDGTAAFGDTATLARTLARVKEPWTFGLEPTEIRAFLAERGLTLLDDLGSREYRARYLGARGRHLEGYEFYRGALAEVAR